MWPSVAYLMSVGKFPGSWATEVLVIVDPSGWMALILLWQGKMLMLPFVI